MPFEIGKVEFPNPFVRKKSPKDINRDIKPGMLCYFRDYYHGINAIKQSSCSLHKYLREMKIHGHTNFYIYTPECAYISAGDLFVILEINENLEAVNLMLLPSENSGRTKLDIVYVSIYDSVLFKEYTQEMSEDWWYFVNINNSP